MAAVPAELVRLAAGMLAGAILVQGESIEDRYEKLDQLMEGEQAASAGLDIPIGGIIAGAIISLAFQVMFGFWGKQAAEQHGIHPAIGFALGFFFYWMGVKMVPIFRRDRLINQPVLPPRPELMNAPNPMYIPAAPAYTPPPQAVHYPAPQPQPLPPQPPPQQMLMADAQGYVNCPGCGSRTKSGRKTCMTCGGHLPAVYNPHLK